MVMPSMPQKTSRELDALIATLVAAALLAWLSFYDLEPASRCETILAQERLGASIVMAALRERAVQVEEQKILAEVKAIQNHAARVKAEQELGSLLAERVVVPEPEPRPVSMTGAAGVISLLNRWAPGLVQGGVRVR